MRWFNHKLTAFSITYAVSGNLILSTAAAVTSIVPDVVEMGIGGLIFRKHRGLSHNPFFWGPLLLLLWTIGTVEQFSAPLPGVLGSITPIIFYGACAGIALHLFTDSLSIGGIPLFGRGSRLAFRTYRTFRISEHVVAAIIVSLSALVIYW